MSIVVSADLAAAIEADERTPLVRFMVDWDNDGFGPAGSVDDLSGKQGTVTIDRTLTTDLPDPVRLVEGSSAATATVQLAEGDRTDETMHAARYFTAASDSVLSHREHKNRPATLDIGFITAAGPQYVRRFTGLTRKVTTAARGRTASLSLLDNRAKLRNTVTLIPTNGLVAGADGTWIITQALYANGIGAGPLPRSSGLIMWAPMYGSVTPIRPDRNPSWVNQFSDITFAHSLTPRFRPGPFVLAADAYYNTDPDSVWLEISTTPIDPTWTSLRGRLEMWVLGITPGAPAPVGQHLRATLGLIRSDVTGNSVRIGFGLDNRMHLWISDTVTDATIHHNISAAQVPADGAWHAVGVHWDHTAATVTFLVDASRETQATGVVPGDVPSSSPAMSLTALTPVSDVLVHDIDATAPWLVDTLVIGAIIDPSLIKLVASYESNPREGWDLITEVAGAEQAVAAWDEAGLFRYRTRRRLVDHAGQTVQRVLTTSDGSLLDVQIDDGIDQVRNVIQVSYAPVSVSPLLGYVYADTISRVIPAQSTLDAPISFTSPVLVLEQFLTFYPFSFIAADGGVDFITGPYMVVTTRSDFGDDTGASGAYTGLLSAAILPGWTPAAATVRFTNLSTVPLYITQIGAFGSAATVGNAVVAQATSPTSIATYGPQPLQVSMPQWVQSGDVALSLAAALLGDLKDAHPTVTGLQVVGDPRRQLGDRVELADPDGTHLDGEFWLTQVTDQIDQNGGYAQTIAARGATTVARYGAGRYGIETYG